MREVIGTGVDEVIVRCISKALLFVLRSVLFAQTNSRTASSLRVRLTQDTFQFIQHVSVSM